MENINITGGEDVYGDPERSRWFTGVPSRLADFTVLERLVAERVEEGTASWAKRYREIFEQVKREIAQEALAAYPKMDVVLMSCEAYKQQRCMAKTSMPCAAMPGETDPTTGEVNRTGRIRP